ncbi:hypothetical protein DM02DRAFT_694583 [Periconia macrospinosa]|uniref:Glycoside hydrolase family 2 protein n=1 Tax=Periconia macrospinosa TaxID=97972 RepID=A0A2V1E0H6_9PLEO|nr:hypothetical protein DM02DRAFT_694583 [Periconia macrospinosa]
MTFAEISRLPDASVSEVSVQDDIHQIASIGGGGLEFLPFYNYGLGPALTDWSIYGFGTDAFKKLFHAALKTSASLNLTFDFALGPNQGSGVPSVVETPGLAKQLVYGNATIQSGATFRGELPEPNLGFNQFPGFMNPLELWGSNELVAVVAGRIVIENLLSGNHYVSVLEENSLINLTNITNEGTLTWTAPEGNETWIIFSIYERYTNQRSCVSIANATTALGNGSWMVDHWSARGAKLTTDFWDQQILSDASIAALMRDAGGYAWEDSMEMQAAVPWTSDLIVRFNERHGYDITPYLPLLFHATNSWNMLMPPYNITYTLGEYMTDGGPYVEDYKAVLTQGYLDYVEHYNEWASSKGVQSSNQPAYNLPIDMAEAVSHVQVPELESLGFKEDIDLYRQFTGPAHLAGRNIISTEVGAVSVGAYKLTIPKLKTLFDQSYAAGVNTMVVHGYAYGGQYYNTTWPGYTPFQYQYTEMWNHRQPAWRHMDELFTYSARNSVIMRSGVPKVDLAFYYFENPWKFAKIYPSSEMNKYGEQEKGYTFEYLSATNLISEEAVVIDGVLAPEGPAFQALIIYNQTQITPSVSAELLQFAKNRLPIYIVGAIPNTTVGATGQQEVSKNINKLLGYSTVRVVDIESFSASILAADGVPARTQVDAASDASGLYTFWTSDVDSHTEYVYLYNQGISAVFNVTFSVGVDLVPYILDAWTGSQRPWALFGRKCTAVNMTIDLRANQTMIIAFVGDHQKRFSRHIADHSPDVKSVHYTKDGGLEAFVAGNSSAWVTLNNGTDVILPEGSLPLPSITTLDSWNLTVESHGPYLNGSSFEANITTIDVGMLDHLVPWTRIPQIEHVSGIGTYRTQFYTKTDEATALLVNFGPVLHTMKAWLNGKQVLAIDSTHPVVDVSDLVVSGSNIMEIEITTSLFNAVKANIDRIMSIGHGPNLPSLYTDAEWEEFGLVGPVELKAFRRVSI